MRRSGKQVVALSTGTVSSRPLVTLARSVRLRPSGGKSCVECTDLRRWRFSPAFCILRRFARNGAGFGRPDRRAFWCNVRLLPTFCAVHGCYAGPRQRQRPGVGFGPMLNERIEGGKVRHRGTSQVIGRPRRPRRVAPTKSEGPSGISHDVEVTWARNPDPVGARSGSVPTAPAPRCAGAQGQVPPIPQPARRRPAAP